jgi:hypothetical protein
LFQNCQNAEVLRVPVEAAEIAKKLVQHLLAGVTKWWVPNVVREADGFREIGIRAQTQR